MLFFSHKIIKKNHKKLLPIIAKAYAHRMPHSPTSKRFASGPQIFLNSSEFHPNGKLTQATIMEIAGMDMKMFSLTITDSLVEQWLEL